VSYAVDSEGRVFREPDEPRIHLPRPQRHDEIAPWCGSDEYLDGTASIAETDCHACLQAAGAFGLAAMRRLDALLAAEDPDDETARLCACPTKGACRYCATESVVEYETIAQFEKAFGRKPRLTAPTEEIK
jgi:hypothetical protein